MTRRRSFLLAAASLIALAMTTPARADDGWGDGVQVMDESEMSDLRGGLRVNGIDIGVGAVITTYANGVRALQTTLTWTDAGAVVSETLGDIGQSLASLSQQQRAELGLTGMGGLDGVVIADGAGVTTLAHNVTNGALQNIVINNATGRDLAQNVDVTITLPGFEATQGLFDSQRVGVRLGADVAEAMSRSLGD